MDTHCPSPYRPPDYLSAISPSSQGIGRFVCLLLTRCNWRAARVDSFNCVQYTTATFNISNNALLSGDISFGASIARLGGCYALFPCCLIILAFTGFIVSFIVVLVVLGGGDRA